MPTESMALRVLQRGRGIFVVALDATDQRVVVKDIRRNTHLKTPRDLLRVHRFVSNHHPRLAASLPKILGLVPRRGWIVMDYIEGATLETVLKKGLSRGETINALLTELGEVFAAFKGLNPSPTGLQFTPWRNDKVLSVFEPIFTHRSIARYLPPEMDTPAKFYRRFSPEVFTRKNENLGLVDCQPKNVIVSPAGALTLIDPDYTVINPALVVAHFLISLDRLGLRRPWGSTLSRIRCWQRCFLSAYLKNTDSAFAQDLAFFYPTTLLRVYRRHAAARPWATTYLRWYYGNRLKVFLDRLKEFPSHRYSETLTDLFG